MTREVTPLDGIDMARGDDQMAIARLQLATYGTGIFIVEAPKMSGSRLMDTLEEMEAHIRAIDVTTIHDPFWAVVPPQEWSWSFLAIDAPPAWGPYARLYSARRRPQQRSAKMRRHARIVRSRMHPSEKRATVAEFDRLRRMVDAGGIAFPDPSKQLEELTKP